MTGVQTCALPIFMVAQFSVTEIDSGSKDNLFSFPYFRLFRKFYTLHIQNGISMMKALISIIVLLTFSFGVQAEKYILEKLQQVAEISGIREMNVSPFSEYYEFWYEQPLDHDIFLPLCLSNLLLTL